MTPSDAPAPLVSVVIPTFNYARFVTDAVDSVLAQTYPSLEIVVVDDGSTDDTREVLARYGDRIRYIYQPNAGLPAARNTGIKAARGEFIGLLDSDDIFHPRKFELQMRYMLAHPEVGMLATDNFTGQSPCWEDPPADPAVEPVPVEAIVTRSRFGVCGVVIRRECFEEVGLFDESLRSAEDREMWIRLAARFPVMKLQAKTFWYRPHAGSMSRAAAKMEHFEFQALDRAFTLPTLRDRWWLERRARSVAAFSAGLRYRDAGMHGTALRRIIRSLWLWPLPHPHEDAKPFARTKLLFLAPFRLIAGLARPSP